MNSYVNIKRINNDVIDRTFYATDLNSLIQFYIGNGEPPPYIEDTNDNDNEGEGLVISDQEKQEEQTDEDGNVIHRGISKRMFSKSFTIANDVEVKGAELKDGLLKISLERIIPEHKKAKTIDIK